MHPSLAPSPSLPARLRTVLAGVMLSSLVATATAQTIAGRVVGVSDGDTITVLADGHDQYKVRLAEIDAPEKAQAFGQHAKQSLSDLVFAKDVTVEVVDKDRYGRTVGQVYVNATNVNTLQVERGMAWAYRRYLKNQALLGIEQQAREARRGLWADAAPTPPWEYRREQRNGGH